MDELYPNIDNEITPDLEELQKEKDDIIREYSEFLIENRNVKILLDDNGEIIGLQNVY